MINSLSLLQQSVISSSFDPVAEFGANLRFYNKVSGELGEAKGSDTISRVLTNNNVNALMDFRNNYSLVSTTYTSDFIPDIDSWLIGNGGSSIEFNQTIGGSSGWLKFTLDNLVGQHMFRRLIAGLTATSFKLTFKLYFPSTNILMNGILATVDGFIGANSLLNQNSDKVINAEINFVNGNATSEIRLYLYDGLTISYLGNNDVVYIKDLVLTKRDGTPMTQDTPADMGTYQPATKDILFDGISDYYDSLNNWADIKNDTKGSMHFRITDLEGSGNSLAILDFKGTNDQLLLYIDAGLNKILLWTKVAGVVSYLSPVAVTTRSVTTTFGIWSDGVTSKLWINGVSVAHTWTAAVRWCSVIGAITAGAVGFGIGTAIYYNMRYKGCLITGGNVVTDAQAMKIHNDLS